MTSKPSHNQRTHTLLRNKQIETIRKIRGQNSPKHRQCIKTQCISMQLPMNHWSMTVTRRKPAQKPGNVSLRSRVATGRVPANFHYPYLYFFKI